MFEWMEEEEYTEVFRYEDLNEVAKFNLREDYMDDIEEYLSELGIFEEEIQNFRDNHEREPTAEEYTQIINETIEKEAHMYFDSHHFMWKNENGHEFDDC
ncbi:MAG: hypothetical protein QP733_02775 [Dialister micraerophilus]|uniref:hypothetical protein n=1 Tax=Dialister micraerophilus TaxID=309120 RepID=UPI00254EC5A1|nr:hypothetical protein [Dialister micraerophilus]MDK8253363.1 hypothetical protein [Dialister micraerophilus]